MTRFLILTVEQADEARGLTSEDTALDPVALVDGSFGLPVSVLDDPAHAAHWALLAPLPEREVGPHDLLMTELDE